MNFKSLNPDIRTVCTAVFKEDIAFALYLVICEIQDGQLSQNQRWVYNVVWLIKQVKSCKYSLPSDVNFMKENDSQHPEGGGTN